MMVAIHQPHYFPWLGYLAKMASVDKFILMDTVQLEKCSYMIRNRVIDLDGNIKYLTISAEKHGFLEKEICDAIAPIFREEHELLCEVTIHSINILREIFKINTPVALQSDIELDKSLKKGKLVLEICKAFGADVYYAGRGTSMQYLDVEECEREGVHVVYQNFCHPIYEQIGNHPFVQGLSALDLLFNQGIEKSREIFWNSVERKNTGYGNMDRV